MWFHHYLHKHDLSSTIDLFHTGLTQNMNNGFVPFKCPVSRDGVNNSTELKQRSIVDSLLCCSSCDGSACLPRWRLVRLHACPTSTDFIPFQMNSENQSDRFQRLPADVSTLEDPLIQRLSNFVCRAPKMFLPQQNVTKWSTLNFYLNNNFVGLLHYLCF